MASERGEYKKINLSKQQGANWFVWNIVFVLQSSEEMDRGR